MSARRIPGRRDPAPAFALDPARIDHMVMTRGAHDALGGGLRATAAVTPLLHRHFQGDWGETGPEDARLNDAAVRDGGRTLGVYTVRGVTLWIIVDAVYDEATGRRYAATVLRPQEY